MGVGCCNLGKSFRKGTDFFEGVVEIKRGTHGGLDAKLLVQGLGTMVPRAHHDRVAIRENLSRPQPDGLLSTKSQT
jgi:hypothetical protein